MESKEFSKDDLNIINIALRTLLCGMDTALPGFTTEQILHIRGKIAAVKIKTEKIIAHIV